MKKRKTDGSEFEEVGDTMVASPSDTREEFPFKDPNFVHSGKGKATGVRKATQWKTLKHIMVHERGLNWKPDDVTYANIDAPPSFTPAKKYSDISGLPAAYTDPHTKIRYSTTDEFLRIRILPSDIAAGYLSLRRANVGMT